MKKIKVLQFTITNARGGRTQYVLNNLQFIDRDRFQIDFITFSPKIDYEPELISKGCKVHYVKHYPEENETEFIREFNTILSHNYDVIHIHTSYWKGFLVEKLSREAGIPNIIVHAHSTGCPATEDHISEALACAEHMRVRNLIVPKMADQYIACSKSASEWLYGDKINKDKIRILNNAIDTDKFAFDFNIRNKYRKQFNLEDKFVLGNVGRLEYEKNHEFLISVFEDIAKTIDKAVLLLVGDGERRKDLEKLVNEKDLQERVIMLGRRDDVNCIMQAMDLFLLPSRFEGFGIVLVEAQTAGLPCVVSDQIPKEAKITPILRHYALIKDLWVEIIKEYYAEIIGAAAGGYNRRDMSIEVTEAGFNLRKQIKDLESIYTMNIGYLID